MKSTIDAEITTALDRFRAEAETAEWTAHLMLGSTIVALHHAKVALLRCANNSTLRQLTEEIHLHECALGHIDDRLRSFIASTSRLPGGGSDV